MDDLARDYPDEDWLQTDRPKFHAEPWHDFYWQAWHALRYDRAYVGQAGVEMPITFAAMDTYARRYGIEGEAFDRLLRFVSVIDFAYLEIQRKAAEKPAGSDQSKVSLNG